MHPPVRTSFPPTTRLVARHCPSRQLPRATDREGIDGIVDVLFIGKGDIRNRENDSWEIVHRAHASLESFAGRTGSAGRSDVSAGRADPLPGPPGWRPTVLMPLTWPTVSLRSGGLEMNLAFAEMYWCTPF